MAASLTALTGSNSERTAGMTRLTAMIDKLAADVFATPYAPYALENAIQIVAIAHRLSTVRNSDCIMVLEQGRIIDFDPQEQPAEEKADNA